MSKPMRLVALVGALCTTAAVTSLSIAAPGAAPVPAPAAAPEPARLRPPDVARDPAIPFDKYVLSNGLEVILVQDKSVPMVAVDVWYHVGSGNERPGKSGFAHLFEHMLFQGSKNVGNDRHFSILQNIGSDDVNGTTSFDRTNYYEVVPSNQLETVLWLESDRMGYMLPLLTEPSLRNQIEVVRNERRQRIDNVPYGTSNMALYEALYPAGHPYKHQIIGQHEDLTSASLDDVVAFFKTWYVPANATLTIAGDFDTAEAKRLVDKWFGTFPASKKPVAAVPAMPTIKNRTIEISDSFAKLRRVTWAWHTPAHYQPGDAELDVAADALQRVGSGRLYRILVHEKQLAQSVGVGQSSLGFSSVFSVTVTLRTGADLGEVRRIVDGELERLRRDLLSDREVKRVVTENEARAVFELEGLLERAETLQRYNHFLGDPGRLSWDLDRYRAISADAVRTAVQTYLKPDRRIEVITNPSEAGAP